MLQQPPRSTRPDSLFPSTTLFRSGRLQVGQTTADGQHVIVRYLGPKDVAGCVAVCGGMPYPATATAVEDTWVLAWPRARLAELTETYPGIAMNAMRNMGGRLTAMQQRVRALQIGRASGRGQGL